MLPNFCEGLYTIVQVIFNFQMNICRRFYTEILSLFRVSIKVAFNIPDCKGDKGYLAPVHKF